MGPGGGWRLGPGSYYYRQSGILDRLTLEEAGHFLVGAGIGVVTRLAALPALLHWNYHIFKEQTNWLDFTSPGGGGPGHSLTSTDPPPSVEEVGTMITQGGHPMKGGHPDSPKASRGRSRQRCPPGYRWNGKRCVRKD
jgi:hypothetical protein